MTFKQGHNVGKEKLDLTGQKFAFLTAVKYLYTLPQDEKRSSRAVWLFNCDCGNSVELVGTEAKFGIKTHCGCLAVTKDFRETRLGKCYSGMLDRCDNPNNNRYHNYGGRGITVCQEWRTRMGVLNFMNWALANGYSDDLSLDRILVNGNYEPSNCKWSTDEEQANNKTTTRYILYPDGRLIPFTQACKEFGISCKTAMTRIHRGKWNPYLAVSIPVNRKD